MPSRLHQCFRRVLFSYGRLTARLGPLESPWERVAVPVPAAAFGSGSQRHFRNYLEGPSHLPMPSIEAMLEWLRTCEYVSDPEQFHQRDVWQHPGEFEVRRRGDCEDFALWAWRKLADIGIEAEFFVGRALARTQAAGQHAWVVFRRGGDEFLFEPAAKSPRAIRELDDAREEYVPHFAVDHRCETWAFGGYLMDARAREAQQTRGSRGAS